MAQSSNLNLSSNLILSALPQNVFAALQPHLKPVKLAFGDVIAETDERVERVYFPHSGIVSLVVEMEVGQMIETAMVGRDGVVNGTSAMDGKVSLHKGIVQVAGEASAINVDSLRNVANEHEPLRAILIRHEQILLAQAQQSAACNASHSVEERMCRWLLRMRDLAGSDELALTQEFLSQMLGVRRTSASLIAATLQRGGLIRYRRGRINLADINGLREGACECYERVKAHYDRLTS